MKPWHGSCIGAFLVLLIGGSCLIFVVPFSGMMLTTIPSVFDKLTAFYLCPTAANYSYSAYADGSPGHYTELTCMYADGSQEVFTKEQIAVKGYGASLLANAICGGAIVLFLMILAWIIGARWVEARTGGAA